MILDFNESDSHDILHILNKKLVSKEIIDYAWISKTELRFYNNKTVIKGAKIDLNIFSGLSIDEFKSVLSVKFPDDIRLFDEHIKGLIRNIKIDRIIS